jgi:hypothetical protein
MALRAESATFANRANRAGLAFSLSRLTADRLTLPGGISKLTSASRDALTGLI